MHLGTSSRDDGSRATEPWMVFIWYGDLFDLVAVVDGATMDEKMSNCPGDVVVVVAAAAAATADDADGWMDSDSLADS